ncbi:MAG: DUF177 domain-containing protein [Desulfovibrio sp.]|jgi:uncharacterized protein|nr:DUF177 domain-containing protein [Desulfovibrio sp.]
MSTHWVPLQSIPAGGSAYRIADQVFWQGLVDEFALRLRIADPIEAYVRVFPREEGVLFRGNIRGRVSLPCDRCSGDSMVSLNASFDNFEPFPCERPPVKATGMRPSQENAPEETDASVIRLAAHGKGIEINPSALAWEEFSLALPLKPLCSRDCKGLCPFCGCDRNTDDCSCGAGRADPRLSVLQGLVIHKK